MQSPVLEFDKKNCTQNASFLQKLDFCIFEPKNSWSDRKIVSEYDQEIPQSQTVENSSKTPLNFSPLQCTYLGKKSFQYH